MNNYSEFNTFLVENRAIAEDRKAMRPHVKKLQQFVHFITQKYKQPYLSLLQKLVGFDDLEQKRRYLKTLDAIKQRSNFPPEQTPAFIQAIRHIDNAL